MNDPMITPTALATFGGLTAAGTLLGMPVDAVVLGAVASAAVTMMTAPKNRWLVVSYTIIGGLLGGAFAPPLARLLISYYPQAAAERDVLALVFAPVAIGLLWQAFLKIIRTLYPSFERHADIIIEWLIGLLPWRPKK